MRRFLKTVGLLLALSAGVSAQRELSGAAASRLALERLGNTGSVLMIAAHPDDENTALLAWLARGQKLRTGYLSLTRGEGGQNLIGSEQGDELGVIRTQELLAARRIDGAEQFFTRAIDFGFTKTPAETFEKWGREKILGDVVWVIRNFRPDVIVLRFSGTPRDGHGQHQASAILGKEAFSVAADPGRFPEQLKYVQPWQAKRLMWNAFSFNPEQEKEAQALPNKIQVDPGEFDPLLGHSYAEIAGMSRSQHRSQAMGSPEWRGTQKQILANLAGDVPHSGPMDDIDITWNRVHGGAKVGELLDRALQAYQPENPAKAVPFLLDALAALKPLQDPIALRKRRDIEEAAVLCAGLWLDAAADKFAVVPGDGVKISATAIDRGPLSIEVQRVSLTGAVAASNNGPGVLEHNKAAVNALPVTIPAGESYTQPYWLREPRRGSTYTVSDQRLIGTADNSPVLQAEFALASGGKSWTVTRPVIHRYVDRGQGELIRPLTIVPPVQMHVSEKTLVFPGGPAKRVSVQVQSPGPAAQGSISLRVPAGWRAEPSSQPFQLKDSGEENSFSFSVTPPAQDSSGVMTAVARVGDREIEVATETIRYPHIPPETLFSRAETRLVRADIRIAAHTIGYVVGAGDEVPEALRQLGTDVALLSADDLAQGDLARFDAIVTGVRAYNVRPDLRANQGRLLAYCEHGGTLVIQYNVREGGFLGGNPALLDHVGPYPLKVGTDRVTVEESPITFPDPNSSLLQWPNHITQADFTGWIQERGLYFPTTWDERYHPLWETHDPGEKPMLGGTLTARYGKGVYVYTAMSWFRELPAGVPGAYRIFANLLSAGKAPVPGQTATR